jgi:hypothetical protein
MKQLGDLVLPDSLQWTDQWQWSPVGQETARTLGGTSVSWSQSLTGGQPITLEATDDCTWLTLDDAAALLAMAAQAGAVFPLIWEDQTFDVQFRHHDPPAVALHPIEPHAPKLVGTIKLMT